MRRSRREEDAAISDFALDDDAMTALSALDRASRTDPDPDTFDRVRG